MLLITYSNEIFNLKRLDRTLLYAIGNGLICKKKKNEKRSSHT